MARKKCSLDGCSTSNYKFELCLKHLQDAVDAGTVTATLCSLGDGRVAVGAEMCAFHYNRHKKGIPLDQPVRRRDKSGKFEVNGYVMVHDGVAWVYEHRKVMSESLGRPLESHETVHHINGVRSDNRLSNLQLRLGHHGQGAVYRCMDCGSSNISALQL